MVRIKVEIKIVPVATRVATDSKYTLFLRTTCIYYVRTSYWIKSNRQAIFSCLPIINLHAWLRNRETDKRTEYRQFAIRSNVKNYSRMVNKLFAREKNGKEWERNNGAIIAVLLESFSIPLPEKLYYIFHIHEAFPGRWWKPFLDRGGLSISPATWTALREN